MPHVENERPPGDAVKVYRSDTISRNVEDVLDMSDILHRDQSKWPMKRALQKRVDQLERRVEEDVRPERRPR